jgi:hypothetical protein
MAAEIDKFFASRAGRGGNGAGGSGESGGGDPKDGDFNADDLSNDGNNSSDDMSESFMKPPSKNAKKNIGEKSKKGGKSKVPKFSRKSNVSQSDKKLLVKLVARIDPQNKLKNSSNDANGVTKKNKIRDKIVESFNQQCAREIPSTWEQLRGILKREKEKVGKNQIVSNAIVVAQVLKVQLRFFCSQSKKLSDSGKVVVDD